MKKIIFLAALVAAVVPASAQISFQSEEIQFVPGDLTTDNAAKVYTIDNDDNVEVYDASLNRIKSFKMTINKATQGDKEERCSNPENMILSGCELNEYGEYRYWDENSNEEVVLTATSVDDMIAKIYFLENQKSLYKININGKAGAYNGHDFYSIGEDGKVFRFTWYFHSWESTMEFVNEDALTWETISEGLYEYGYAEELEYYNFDNSTNSADMDFVISQTLFNDDSKWEYVVKKFGPLKIEYTNYRIDQFDGSNGRAIVYRTARYGVSIAGFSIMNEDGTEVGFIASPDGDYLYLYDVVVIGNKKYLRAAGDELYYLFDLDNLGGAALVVERKDNMRVVSQGDVVEIILPKNAANGEVGIVGMNGQTLGRQKVSDGQSRARFNSANLAKGVYNATFTHKNGKRESQKFVVK